MRVAHRPKSRYPSRLVRFGGNWISQPSTPHGGSPFWGASLTLHQFLPDPCWRPHANLYITTTQSIRNSACPSLSSVLITLSPTLPNPENLRVAPGGFSISGYSCHENRHSLAGPSARLPGRLSKHINWPAPVAQFHVLIFLGGVIATRHRSARAGLRCV
jgi:hypothetical protein